jgi:hypothetical protein
MRKREKEKLGKPDLPMISTKAGAYSGLLELT